MNIENLPIHLILRILKYFQTSIVLPQQISKTVFLQKRKNLARGLGVQTDIETLVNLANSSRFWNRFFRNEGIIFFVVYYDSIRMQRVIAHPTYVHSSFCEQLNCTNVCHYVTKDIKHTDILKKITKHHLSREKSLAKNRANTLNDTTQFSKSSQLDTISTDSDSDCIL